jgi:hypothetical protein
MLSAVTVKIRSGTVYYYVLDARVQPGNFLQTILRLGIRESCLAKQLGATPIPRIAPRRALP